MGVNNNLFGRFEIESIFSCPTVVFHLETGAIQKIYGSIDNGYWDIKNVKFYANIPCNDGKYHDFEIDMTSALKINWIEVNKKFHEMDCEKLPSSIVLDSGGYLDILLHYGILKYFSDDNGLNYDYTVEDEYLMQ